MNNQKVGNVSPKHCVGDSRLDPVFGRKSENRLNCCDLSAKGRPPWRNQFLTKIPLIYYKINIIIYVYYFSRTMIEIDYLI
ncbi:MAG: hypothetical protein LBI18_02980 [Planctomycetaceae bacterium]|nr:hypothetical protein [Planctomycetaceae bacterium]